MGRLGNDLNAIQQGKRPFSQIKDRALYCAIFADTVYILHIFTKTTNKVDQKQMDTAAARYKEMTTQLRAEGAAAKKLARRG